MSEQTKPPPSRTAWIVPMWPRSPHDEHRAATPLELFFDLVFVIAVAQASSKLHHGIAEAHVVEAVVGYAMVFFAIWWAWMNFTWFASAYDNDDVLYRLAVFGQMTGALILAAGVPQAFDERNFTVATAGYVVMRLPLVAQWLRAARSDPERRTCAHRYAIGVSACQIGWVVLLFLPASWGLSGFIILVVAELLVPIWAEQAKATPWHREHIAERYGLFTIIVLGESILAASLAIQSAIQADEFNINLAAILIGGLLVIFTMWWFYFDYPTHNLLTSLRTAFLWGYGHLLIFASAAAVGAGLAVAVDQAMHHTEISSLAAGFAITIPISIYLIGLWVLHELPRTQSWGTALRVPLVTLFILATSVTGQAVLLTGLLLAGYLAFKLVDRYRMPAMLMRKG